MKLMIFVYCTFAIKKKSYPEDKIIGEGNHLSVNQYGDINKARPCT